MNARPPDPIDAVWIAQRFKECTLLAAAEFTGQRSVDPRAVAERTSLRFYAAIVGRVGDAEAVHLSRLQARPHGDGAIVFTMTAALRGYLDTANRLEDAEQEPCDLPGCDVHGTPKLRAIAGGAKETTPPRAALRDVTTGKTHRAPVSEVRMFGLGELEDLRAEVGTATLAPARLLPTDEEIAEAFHAASTTVGREAPAVREHWEKLVKRAGLVTSLGPGTYPTRAPATLTVRQRLRSPELDAAADVLLLAQIRHVGAPMPVGRTYREIVTRAERRRYEERRAVVEARAVRHHIWQGLLEEWLDEEDGIKAPESRP